MLGPYRAQSGYGEAMTAPEPAPEPESNAWNRMQSLFPVMQAMHDAYVSGELHPASYLQLGPATLAHVKAISEIWGSDIEPSGWEAIWGHIKKEVEEKLAADDAAALTEKSPPL